MPHASPWYSHEPKDLAGTERDYGPAIDGDDPTYFHIVEIDGKPLGYVQHYLLSSYPGYETTMGVERAAGIDFIIGDPDHVGRGLGPRIIRQYIDDVVLPAHPEVHRLTSSPSPDNTRSIRALEKAGFRQVRTVVVEGNPERLCLLEVRP